MKRLFALRIDGLGLIVDLCINNILGVYNSKLIHTYCILDERYHSLCRLIKFLHNLHKPYAGQETQKLTNYALNLMLLVFLQSKRVLPNILRPSDKRGMIEYEMQYKIT
jgi:DNA polymerase sigma